MGLLRRARCAFELPLSRGRTMYLFGCLASREAQAELSLTAAAMLYYTEVRSRWSRQAVFPGQCRVCRLKRQIGHHAYTASA